MPVKKVSILGVTGSVGQSAADVIRAQPGRFDIQAVTARSNAALLAKQAVDLGAKIAVIADEHYYAPLKDALSGSGIEAAAGQDALLAAASLSCDTVVGAIVGFDGLLPVMKAIEAGANVALANKEPLVAAGHLVVPAAERKGVRLLPVDSEHNAIFQVFEESQRRAITRLILTASGGPFREWRYEDMEKATPEQAVAHPNWSMGPKISVDSATLMNKALEVIEAHYLFKMPADKIEVVIHPQSIIHSMVEYEDGSVLAQMGAPDMCTPIAYCLGWPDRIASPGQKLNFKHIMNLSFQPLDNKFKSVSLAYECLAAGPAHCLAFNAANEVAVAAFLEGRIGFNGIVRAVTAIIENIKLQKLDSLEAVVSCDKAVRAVTLNYMNTGKVQTSDLEVYAA